MAKPKVLTEEGLPKNPEGSLPKGEGGKTEGFDGRGITKEPGGIILIIIFTPISLTAQRNGKKQVFPKGSLPRGEGGKTKGFDGRGIKKIPGGSAIL